MGAHARFSPSASKRYLNCPPALRLEEQFADEESIYAAEGSAGHALAEHLIKKYLKQRTKRPVSDYYSDDLLEAVDEYVAYVIETGVCHSDLFCGAACGCVRVCVRVFWNRRYDDRDREKGSYH